MGFVLFTFIACENTPTRAKGEAITVGLDNPSLHDYSELFERVELIPLDLNQNSAIKFPKQVIEHDGYFYIQDHAALEVFIFSSRGEFVRSIRNVGYGPLEYYSIADININPYTGHLEILDQKIGKLVVYDPKIDEFVDALLIPMPGNLRSYHNFVQLNADMILLHSRYGDNQLHWYSRKSGEIVHSDFPRLLNFGLFQLVTLKRIVDQVYFFHINENRIYSISDTGYTVNKSFDFGENDLRQHIGKYPHLFKGQDDNGKIGIEEIRVKENLAYPISNYFFNLDALQFIYAEDLWLYQPSNEYMYPLHLSLDGIPLIWEQGEYCYGMILNGAKYKESLPSMVLTESNKKVLENWEEGDNTIIAKFKVK